MEPTYKLTAGTTITFNVVVTSGTNQKYLYATTPGAQSTLINTQEDK
jgi:hypothetical protein